MMLLGWKPSDRSAAMARPEVWIPGYSAFHNNRPPTPLGFWGGWLGSVMGRPPRDGNLDGRIVLSIHQIKKIAKLLSKRDINTFYKHLDVNILLGYQKLDSLTLKFFIEIKRELLSRA